MDKTIEEPKVCVPAELWKEVAELVEHAKFQRETHHEVNSFDREARYHYLHRCLSRIGGRPFTREWLKNNPSPSPF